MSPSKAVTRGDERQPPRPIRHAAALPPWLEQTLLFGLFAAAALFWIAVIVWIVL